MTNTTHSKRGRDAAIGLPTDVMQATFNRLIAEYSNKFPYEGMVGESRLAQQKRVIEATRTAFTRKFPCAHPEFRFLVNVILGDRENK